MSIERLISDRPKLHARPCGTLVNWAVSDEALKFIYENLEPGITTLETGAGYTTIVFAIAGTNHISITPSKDECERIVKYCSEINIDPHITFLNQGSDIALVGPQSIPSHLDFVFIDGAHRFPFPCIDFHYTENKLRVGGILGVDNVPMPSVRILYNFLCGEAEWKLIKKIHDTAFFKKVAESRIIKDWHGQNINRAYERKTNNKSFLINVCRKIYHLLKKKFSTSYFL
ncbi:MAG: hypothetical protein ISS26_04335 [Candidatus Omnitrophica bacterium]|nr:hypothetical protein [Candidatus Omnitrophota bacterium]